MKLSRGITIVFIANIINLGFNLLSNFLLPKYLSIDTYSTIKTFQLYINYIGILHLGFVDGMYLRYGGKRLDSIALQEVGKDFSTLRLFQAVISMLAFAVALLARDNVLIIIALCVLPYNMSMMYKMVYQAVGEFKSYGRIMNMTTIAMFIVNMVLLFVLHTDNDQLYLWLYLGIYAAVWILLELSWSKSVPAFRGSMAFSVSSLVANIKSGILLMLGNFASVFQTGMDRWFVKGLMDNGAFAQYSFAVSMEGMMNVAVTPITVTMYNYFCTEKDIEKRKNVSRLIMLFACMIVSCAYPAKLVLEVFLHEYIASSSVIFYLFGAQIFYIIVKSVFVNLYKAKKLQNKYFSKLLVVIIAGIVFNIVFYACLHTKEAFAIGTLLTAIMWYIFSLPDFPELCVGIRENAYLAIEICLFIFCGETLGAISGFVVYFVASVAAMLVFMNSELKFAIKMLLARIVSRNRI